MTTQITKRYFGTTPGGYKVTEFTLKNRHGLELKVINYGCTITSLKVPDRNGAFADIVLGYDDLEGYLQSNAYVGCVVGRFANRIAHGKFSLDGKEISLALNASPHHIHGGQKGFGRVVWTAEEIQDEKGIGVIFHHLSRDGEEGYPGNLQVAVKYFLGNDNTLSFEYLATTDQDTIINLTQHSYFNLNGGKKNILDHELTLLADHFLPVDDTMIPTGEMRQVENTPFDFRKAKPVGNDIAMPDSQLTIGHGYDHCWVIHHPEEGLRLAATLFDTESGRRMEVYTTEPGIQLYTANFLNAAMPGKKNIPLTPRLGLCLETQHFPDAPNRASFPPALLSAGKVFRSTTSLSFSCQ